MSEDELRKDKQEVLLEFQEAEDVLAALKAKAAKQGGLIQQFGKWLAEDAARKIYCAPQDQHGLLVDRLDFQFKSAVDFDAALALADEIRAATARLKTLEERKRDLRVR